MSSSDSSLEPSDAETTENDLSDFKTLEQFILEQQDRFPHSTGAFSRLLRDIGLAAKIVNRDVRRAGLDDISGTTGRTNVQGETQQKMDALAHRHRGAGRWTGHRWDPAGPGEISRDAPPAHPALYRQSGDGDPGRVVSYGRGSYGPGRGRRGPIETGVRVCRRHRLLRPWGHWAGARVSEPPYGIGTQTVVPTIPPK